MQLLPTSVIDFQHMWSTTVAWLSNTAGLDLVLFVVFVAHLAAVFRFVTGASFIPSSARTSNIDAKIPKEVCCADSAMCSEESPQRTMVKPDGADRLCRPRCPAIRAQSAGLPPTLPETCTTLILRNVPASYTPDALLAIVHEEGYFGEVDFIYVPIDFKKPDCSLGFAVLNFRTSSACSMFASDFHMASACEKMQTSKAIKKYLEVSPSKIQGFRENAKRLQKSNVLAWLARYPAWLPRVVDRGGLGVPLKGVHRSSRAKRPSSDSA